MNMLGQHTERQTTKRSSGWLKNLSLESNLLDKLFERVEINWLFIRKTKPILLKVLSPLHPYVL
jgi:hypothetical protein